MDMRYTWIVHILHWWLVYIAFSIWIARHANVAVGPNNEVDGG